MTYYRPVKQTERMYIHMDRSSFRTSFVGTSETYFFTTFNLLTYVINHVMLDYTNNDTIVFIDPSCLDP